MQETVRHFQFFFLCSSQGRLGFTLPYNFFIPLTFLSNFLGPISYLLKGKQLLCDSLVSLGKIDAFTMAQEKYSPQLHCMKILLHFCCQFFNIHFVKFNYAWSWRAIYNSISFSTNTHPMCYVSIGGILCGQCFYSNTCRHDKAIRICNNKNTKKSKHCNVPAAALLLF